MINKARGEEYYKRWTHQGWQWLLRYVWRKLLTALKGCFPVNDVFLWAKTPILSEKKISGLLLTSVPLVFYP